MSKCSEYTLAEATDLFMIARGITKKKYFGSYLVVARFVWKEIFKNTLWQTQSEWMTMQRGDPFNYVYVPQGAERIFSVAVEDDCRNLVPLFYNNKMSVVKKPTKKKCGCTKCDCAGLCEELNSLTVTTKLQFTINGENYYQKTWLQVCSNGDILQWSSTPVKKYNNLSGDAGDFNDDYNDDYSTASAPFSDYTIEYVEEQKKICKIETAPCGCPIDSEENVEIFNTFCSGFCNCCSPLKKRHCDDILLNPNNNHRGEVKISECGTKLYYKPSPHWRRNSITERIPEFLLVNFQTDGETPGQSVMVPEYALKCLHAGMLHNSTFLKDISPNVKLANKYQYEDEKNNVIRYLNPLSLENLANIQDAPVRW